MPSHNMIIPTEPGEDTGPSLFEVHGYQILEKLSENAAFIMYRGRRPQDQAPVRLKVLNQSRPTPKLLAPLWQEFEILRQLDLAGVEKAYALENHQQWWMIVLDDSGGTPMDELELAGRMEPKEFLDLALQLARILEGIHEHRVIHKNISPSNISFNTSTRQAQLTNFGFASLISKEKVPFQSPYKLAEFLAYTSPELTGRMNRSVDYRTDYYSLGATLYELLTGTPPFIGNSPLELVHAHLAILPESPSARIQPWSASPTAFEMISTILLKLMAKNPEDRYQTSTALQVDLRHCLSVLLEPSKAELQTHPFAPGELDRPIVLNVPQVVVGREQETRALLQAFHRTVQGPKELVVVTGEAGVGKTTLVNQLVRTVTQQKGLFLYAKNDQARHLEVYPLLIDLLEEFCRLVLSEPASSFNEWQEKIQNAIAPHGQLLIDLCPQLEAIVGLQPPLEPVDADSVRSRFHQTVIRFLQAISRPDHHVVLFLDDLHWISQDSLLLWRSILSNTSLQNLLVVAAFRDDELDTEHPIHSLLQEVKISQGHLIHLYLQNLEPPMAQTLIAIALALDPAEISELASLVYQRTEGNPYYTIEFLKSLYKDQLLFFSPEDRKWHWDGNRIDEYSIAANVVDFFVHEIVNLDEATQKILQYAALTGTRFDAAILLAIFGKEKASELVFGLWRATLEGLIFPLDENYRALAGDKDRGLKAGDRQFLPSLADLLEQHILFEFQHDRVQQAALALLDEKHLMTASLEIGWLLLAKAERAGQEALQEKLVAIVDHLNTGSALIEDANDRIKTAQLILIASNQARASAAFDVASRYLATGIQLLPQESWKDHYTLTLELFTARAEVALLNGDLQLAEELAQTGEANAGNPLEMARFMRIRMEIYTIQTRLDKVFDLGIAIIRMLGFDLEIKEPFVWSADQAVRLPPMTDPQALEVARLVEPMTTAAFGRNDPRFKQMNLFFLDLFSRFGNPPVASFVYIVHAQLLISEFHRVKEGLKIGKMALEMAEKQGPSRNLYAVRFVYHAFIHHWLAPARECLSPLDENAQPSFENGNLIFSIDSQDLGAQNSLFVGLKLEQVRSKQAEALRQLSFLKHVKSTQRLRIWSQLVLKLTGEHPDPFEIHGEQFREEEAQALLEDDQNQIYLFNLYVAQSFLSLLFRQPQRALEASKKASTYIVNGLSQLIFTQHVFVYSLVLLSLRLENTGLSNRLKKVEDNLRLMRLWASLVPENFLHQLELVEAELARSLGREEEAVEKYERAIRDARQNGYLHQSALAAELAAEYFISQEAYSTANEYLATAYSSYLAWGALAKVKDLENRYPEWLPPGKESQQTVVNPPVEDRAANELASTIDLNTIIKASIELSQETSLEELLRKMMAILMENAGAQHGLLLLVQNDRWFLKVRGSTDPEEGFAYLSTPMEYLAPRVGEPYIPISIIHYVMNLKEDLVLEDASNSRQFSRDPYITRRQPKSVLCAPLLNQGLLTGVIYLENNLIAGAFTSDRLEIVRLLSSQAAVSIENARLYEDLETRVEERTRELSNANRRLKKEIEERIRVEESLRYNEALLRKVLDILPVGVWILDKTARIISGNPESLRIWSGAKYVDWQQFGAYKAWRVETGEIVSPQDWAGGLAVSQGQVTLDEELEIEAFDGTHRFIMNSAIPLVTKEDGLVGAIIVNQDITERKSADQALRYNEALLRRVLDNLPVGIWILDKDARVIRGNREAHSIWSGNDSFEWKDYDQYKAWRLDTGEPVNRKDWAANKVMAKGEMILNEELEIEAYDGTHRIILNSAIPLITEQDGLIGAIAVNQDITERKRNEKELKVAHDQLSTLLDISQSIVSTLDLDRLLNLIIEQLGKVIPYEAAAILILEQNSLGFRVIRGPSIFQNLLNHQVPVDELTIIDDLLNQSEAIYLADLQANQDLIHQIEDNIRISSAHFAFLRSWLLLPLVAKGDLIGVMVLTHSRPDYYSPPSRTLCQAYANQVAIAIHNAQLYKQAGNNAALEERNRLARDLHDSVAQALYSISLFIDATRMALHTDKPEVVDEHLKELTQLSREAMSDMRLMIFELRPPDLEKVGLAGILQNRIESVEARSGFQASFHTEGEIQLSLEQQTELYRIAQEALHNVAKHAQANRVTISLVGEADCVRLAIEDDGIGFDPVKVEQRGGQGLRNMQERAARIGASFSFKSGPGQGTKIWVELKQ